jgi:HEAT repeat protein
VNNINIRDASDEWETECEHQPVRVSLKVSRGSVVKVRTYVGGRWRPDTAVTDFGSVPAREAAAYLLDLAARPGDLDGDPLLPASLADSTTVWPALLRLARNERLPEDRRRSAVFWLSQAAGEAAAAALDSIAVDPTGEREVRKQAVFALSQRSGNEGVPALIRIARTNPDPELRKTALFWLGQSDDPRALDLFEEILR